MFLPTVVTCRIYVIDYLRLIIFLNVIALRPLMCSFMLRPICQCCFAIVKVLLKKVTYLLTYTRKIKPLLICRIRIGIRIRFSESVHSVREPENGFANPANPVLTRIHSRNRKCLAVKMASAIVLLDEYGKRITLTSLPTAPTNPDHSICQ